MLKTSRPQRREFQREEGASFKMRLPSSQRVREEERNKQRELVELYLLNVIRRQVTGSTGSDR